MKHPCRYGSALVLLFFLPMCANTADKKWNQLSAQYQTTLIQARTDYAKSIEALELAKQALEWAKQNFKAHDLRTAQSLLQLGEAYSFSADYAQAEPFYREALALYEKTNKKKTLNYAKTLKGLGTLSAFKGQEDQSLVYYRQAIEVLEKLPEKDHLELAEVLLYTAISHNWSRKDFITAESYYLRSLAIKKKILGPEHPEVAEDTAALASQYRVQGRIAEAESLYKQALVIYEKHYGPEDPKVAAYLERVAGYYHEAKEYTYAEPYFTRALALWEKIRGPENVTLGNFLIKRGNFYNAWGKPDQAEMYYLRELANKEKVLGKDSPELEWSIERLFQFYDNKKNFDQAEKFIIRLHNLREKQMKPDTGAYYEELKDYAEFYVRWARWSQAEEIYRGLLASFKHFPEKNWEFEAWVAERMLHLCVIQYKYGEADLFGKQALAAWEKADSRDKIEFVEFLESLAIYYRGDNKIKEAEEMEQRAKEIRARLPKTETSAP
ncbi:MAG: tetratricopeptide repeat protein [Desulfobacteraceae bacterium]|nr:MAG: tetratricopeptide repeat protein [Desulfobacteraceae bacterium]